MIASSPFIDARTSPVRARYRPGGSPDRVTDRVPIILDTLRNRDFYVCTAQRERNLAHVDWEWCQPSSPCGTPARHRPPRLSDASHLTETGRRPWTRSTATRRWWPSRAIPRRHRQYPSRDTTTSPIRPLKRRPWPVAGSKTPGQRALPACRDRSLYPQGSHDAGE